MAPAWLGSSIWLKMSAKPVRKSKTESLKSISIDVVVLSLMTIVAGALKKSGPPAAGNPNSRWVIFGAADPGRCGRQKERGIRDRRGLWRPYQRCGHQGGGDKRQRGPRGFFLLQISERVERKKRLIQVLRNNYGLHRWCWVCASFRPSRET
jgi:hypothetical protein